MRVKGECQGLCTWCISVSNVLWGRTSGGRLPPPKAGAGCQVVTFVSAPKAETAWSILWASRYIRGEFLKGASISIVLLSLRVEHDLCPLSPTYSINALSTKRTSLRQLIYNAAYKCKTREGKKYYSTTKESFP